MMRDCPDAEMRDLLPEFVHGTLAPAERARVAGHVEACEDCAAEVELIRWARVALAAGAPSVNVSRIVAALPSAPAVPVTTRSRGAWQTSWRIAAGFALVAAGGLSVVVLRNVFDRAPDAGKAPAPRFAAAPPAGPDASPAPQQVAVNPPVREIAAASHADGISFGGGLSDLTDEQLKTLLHDIDALQATPNLEPEVHATPIVTVPVPVPNGDDNAP